MRRVVIAVALLAAFLSFAAHAQTYPSRPITMIVPFPPGGAVDPAARLLAAAMSKTLGQNIVVENKGGAGGAIGHALTARQKPDGYTVLFSNSAIISIPLADDVNGRPSTSRMPDFTPIALITADPTILLVSAASPWKTLADLLADAKARPGKISYSSSGVYGTAHTCFEMFAQAAGIQLLHIPYQGGGPAMLALLSGDVNLSAQLAAVGLPQAKAGKVRVLASWGGTRLPVLADIPTMRELGVNTEYYAWQALFAPARLPREVATTLRNAVRQAVQDSEFRKGMASLNAVVNNMDGAELDAFLENDGKQLGEAIRRIGKTQ